MVSKESIQQELGRILASEVFGGKKQAGKFLRYIVTETLEGRGSRITQYGIAVEALGKSADYCPTESPAVRVEAGRIRKLLEEYYAREGTGSYCRIHLPVGGYMPVFQEPDKHKSEWQWLDEKRVQSAGPKVCFVCQNPATIRDDQLRSTLYNLRSTLPVVLSKLRTIQIALADPISVPASASAALDYAWRRHRAEFLLQCHTTQENGHIRLCYVLTHTQTHEDIWTEVFTLSLPSTEQALELIYERLVQEVFSLHRGVALAFWSRFWFRQGYMPAPYQVVAAHVRYLQDGMNVDNFRLLWDACQKRTLQYHDDALAHLHQAVACLYAYQLEVDIGVPLEDCWQQCALAALELNPGNAMAHSIFALSCFHQGEAELGRVEIETARQSSSFDATCALLLAVGLCALRQWEEGYLLLRDVTGTTKGYPDPLHSVPCLFYYREGRYAALMDEAIGFAKLGGWENFGELVSHCRVGHCKACLKGMNRTLDQLDNKSNTHYAATFDLIPHSTPQHTETRETFKSLSIINPTSLNLP